MKVKVTTEVTLADPTEALVDLLFEKIRELLGSFDDGGCDLYTNGDEVVIGGSPDGVIANHYDAAVLVNAMNIVRYGHKMIVGEDVMTVLTEREALDHRDNTTSVHDYAVVGVGGIASMADWPKNMRRVRFYTCDAFMRVKDACDRHGFEFVADA